MQRGTRAITGICLSLLAILMTGCLLRQGNRVLIPSGYVGWIRVYYEVPNAAPLPVEAGKRVVRVPPNGVIRTSSIHDSRYGVDEYFYSRSDGTLSELPAEGVQGSPTALVHSHLFQSSHPRVHIVFVGPKGMLPRPYNWLEHMALVELHTELLEEVDVVLSHVPQRHPSNTQPRRTLLASTRTHRVLANIASGIASERRQCDTGTLPEPGTA